MMRAVLGTMLIGAALALTGCERRPPPPEPEPTTTHSPKSIFRPEFRVEPEVERPLDPLEVTVLFPEGSELTEDAEAALRSLLESEQAESGGPIVLRGHSDAGGSDETNMRLSRERAEAVRDWLLEEGVAEERISVIAFGEQNPVRANALPDGSPNEEGRAANRRVEITVDPAEAAPRQADEEQTLVETLAEPDPETNESADE